MAVSREHRLEAAGREDGKRCDARYSEDECNLVKSAALRTPHIKIKTPALFVQGDKDPFASPAEIEAALKLIPVKTSLLIIENAGHDLGFRRAASHQETVNKIVSAFRERFLAG